MSSERIKVEKRIEDCGNGWCNGDAPCGGHTLRYTYNSIVDMSTIGIDGVELTSPGIVIDMLAELIVTSNEEQPNE